MTDSIKLNDIQAKLIEIEAPLSVSEYHGHLIGRMVGGQQISGVTGMQIICLLYTSPSPRDQRGSRMPSSA